VAVAAARILGVKEVALIGTLGEDDIARQQIATLEDEGVITTGIQHIAGEESGQAYILVDQTGQNVIASHLGANAGLGSQHLNKAQVKEQLEECRGIVLTDPPLEVVAELINLARRRDVPVLWDQVKVLFLNETEAGALLGADEPGMGLQRLQRLGLRNHTVLKLGAQGAALLEPASSLIVQVPALPVKELGLNVINTVGCGDVFAGVFAAYRVLGASLGESLIMAGAAAGINAARRETRSSPDRASLEEMVDRSHGLGFAAQERKLS
jgi:ribokinase